MSEHEPNLFYDPKLFQSVVKYSFRQKNLCVVQALLKQVEEGKVLLTPESLLFSLLQAAANIPEITC